MARGRGRLGNRGSGGKTLRSLQCYIQPICKHCKLETASCMQAITEHNPRRGPSDNKRISPHMAMCAGALWVRLLRCLKRSKGKWGNPILLRQGFPMIWISLKDTIRGWESLFRLGKIIIFPDPQGKRAVDFQGRCQIWSHRMPTELPTDLAIRMRLGPKTKRVWQRFLKTIDKTSFRTSCSILWKKGWKK